MFAHLAAFDLLLIVLSAGGTVRDSIEFILQNFGEMNKLWVRLQHQGAVRDKTRREKERRNLRQLVGTNLVRLSEMNGVDLATYQEIVLPRILEQIINCKDVIAQEYLMDCIIQVFPVEFHLYTLETYLASCAQLQENVNVKDIIIALMNKLASFAHESPASIPAGMEMFPLFHKYTSQIISSNTKLLITDQLQLQVALLNFATKVYPDRVDYVDNVLGFSTEILTRTGQPKAEPKAVKLVTELLSLPLEVLLLRILELVNFAPLLAFLELQNRRDVASNIMNAMVKARAPLDTVDKVDAVLRYITPAIKDEGPDVGRLVADEDRFEFEQEQHLVARMFQLIANEDTDIHFQLYSTARKYFGQGGTQRIEYTLPALTFGSLQLALRIHDREQALATSAPVTTDGADATEEDGKDGTAAAPPVAATANGTMLVKTKKIFGFIHETISVLTAHFPELALRLFVHAAQISDRCNYNDISYEYIVQAFIAYEEEIADSKAQFAAIILMVASLQTFVNLSPENWDTLVTKATQHCAKLLKKPDQCRAVYQCAHVFWPSDEKQSSLRDEKRVLACLQRSLKIANGCMGQQLHLFVEILNQYLYFYDRQCPSITVQYLKGLISLIEEHTRTSDDSDAAKQAKQHYENTLQHIRIKATEENGERYNEILSGGTATPLE